MVVGLKVPLWSIRDSYSSIRNHICPSSTLRERLEEACRKSNLCSWLPNSNKRGDNFWYSRMTRHLNRISYLIKIYRNYLSSIFNSLSLWHPGPRKVHSRLSLKFTHARVKRTIWNWNSTTRSSGSVCRVRTLSKFKIFIIRRTTTKVLESHRPLPVLSTLPSQIIKELHRTTRCLPFSTLRKALHNNCSKQFSTRSWNNLCLKSNMVKFLSRRVLCSEELTLAKRTIQAASIKAATYGLVCCQMFTSLLTMERTSPINLMRISGRQMMTSW